ncbi:LLM class flavin-dependent oxidoreductase [Acidovorax sp. CCYZU-2555]|uniref:LLM class flavin-dependent oxidoreductase n=1 Tax=Acidovorax sp. CCYZU-2555 TaxID=2835042 RepID=UPI001BCFF2C9|nr:LLM class flavin-dependent oxidoreductase [Acidovorax sp. CCYZU-2555]MBS7780521.1 LLM class flavin-dependent oxidoreductase [Acidovorax sp. CCYZU-2555]
MATPLKHIHLGAFPLDVGHHIAAWRHPDVPASGGSEFGFYRALAQTAERGKLDMIFFGDQMAAQYPEDETLGRTSRVTRLEPTTLLAALAGATTHLGLVGTVSTSYFEPFHVARKFATLDQLSGGRSGWNVVTSFNDKEALNFNRGEVAGHAERYRRALEFVDVTKRLWDSWDDDAFVRDKDSGLYFDPEKLHVLHHRGEFFASRGPLNIPRSPQGRPVIVQAGASHEGRDFSAGQAEVIFTAQPNLQAARGFYQDVKSRAAALGRHADEIRIMPGVMTFIGRTHEEAQEKYQRLQSLIHPQVGWIVLKRHLGIDLSGMPLDEPFPELELTPDFPSRQKLLIDMARGDGLTVRQFYERVVGARGHLLAIGTAAQVADQFEEWIDGQGADGFNLMLPWLPTALDDVVDLLVPELQRRGRFRHEYQGKTLRSHLGLERPASHYARAA